MKHSRAFTLLEVLLVVAVISVLTSTVLPSLMASRGMAREAVCLAHLRGLGQAMSMYHAENRDFFWPYRLSNHPTPGTVCYWWGADADPVDFSASPFMDYCGNLDLLGCPELPWGRYIPQGTHVAEPTTTYGYNAFFLDPKLNGEEAKNINRISSPAGLFVFNDAAMYWKVGDKALFQNSTYLEPVTGNWVQLPTTHFRHAGRTNALCADGHASSFGPEGWDLDHRRNLGFVGTENHPHYAR